MVFTDSCCALSINEQVFTTMTSASSACGTRSAPACESMPIMTSLSTRFLGQPRLTKPTLGADFGASATATVEGFDGMESIDFNIRTGSDLPDGQSPPAPTNQVARSIELPHELRRDREK